MISKYELGLLIIAQLTMFLKIMILVLIFMPGTILIGITPSPSVGDGLEKPSPSMRDGLEKPSLSAKLLKVVRENLLFYKSNK